MKVLRWLGSAVLWIVAAFGVLCGAVWVANLLGLVQPLIVVSGSMSPQIRAGDLIIAVPEEMAEVDVGQVITLRNTLTGNLVTHRVIDIARAPSGDYAVQMKGDANDTPDQEVYEVSETDSVPTPWLVVPQAGRVIETVSRPLVAVPIVISLLALAGLLALPSRRDDDEDEAADDATADAQGSDASVGEEQLLADGGLAEHHDEAEIQAASGDRSSESPRT